ncbi:50S ribosomal protein L28 [Patescibacteria group bacterium]|nr:50S ribosomal protein L28 [Patescibacteria group bacterium]
MAYRCELCDKKTRSGRQHTHHSGVAGGQWKRRAPVTLRTFKPNLHAVTISAEGVLRRVRACTKCIKRAKFDLRKKVVVAPS